MAHLGVPLEHGRVARPGKHEQSRVRDPFGHPLGHPGRSEQVELSGDHERRHADRCQDVRELERVDRGKRGGDGGRPNPARVPNNGRSFDGQRRTSRTRRDADIVSSSAPTALRAGGGKAQPVLAPDVQDPVKDVFMSTIPATRSPSSAGAASAAGP